MHFSGFLNQFLNQIEKKKQNSKKAKKKGHGEPFGPGREASPARHGHHAQSGTTPRCFWH
jgi:hypothetical protein